MSQPSTETTQIPIPESKELEAQAKTALGQVKALVINSAESYAAAATSRNDLLGREKQWHTKLKPICESTDRAHKEATALYRLIVTDGFKEAARIIKQKMIAYDQEQKRLAEKKQIELERQEKERAEQEALEVAELLEAAGAREEAEKVLSEPIKGAPVSVKAGTPKVEGFSYRTNYSAKVTDLPALARAAVAGLVPIQAIQGNEAFLNQQARALKDAFNYPGCELVKDKV